LNYRIRTWTQVKLDRSVLGTEFLEPLLEQRERPPRRDRRAA
jgi:hypothetical protein